MSMRSIFGDLILYLAGRVILSEFQGSGIGSSALQIALQETNPKYVCTVTRNPNVLAMISRAVSVDAHSVYPLSEQGSLPIEQMADLAGVPHNCIPLHADRYPANGLLGEKPPDSRSAEINSYFSSIPLSTGVLIGCNNLTKGETGEYY